ncbi:MULTISPECIES: hypothetical protein [Lysobacter]|uniref:hypothetical protein n=1 Tax=Lysobacter TaxID=68 RepID=UPI001F2659FF|nr:MULTISPECIES: hypothetical protein [Lysobacter]UJB18556.1 hypothetical protein L1A79_19820 [Lysobacter capsici]UJQ27719.1 hypothetical protein L2D09_20065 [Lysobacter gummosus]
MNTDKAQSAVIELLRIGLITIRNFAAMPRRSQRQETMLSEWAELCHTIPPMLLGGCKTEALRYFVEVGGAMFIDKYPDQSATNFGQARNLLDELSVLVQQSDSAPS